MIAGELERSRTGGNRMQVPTEDTTVLCRARLAFRDILSARQPAVQVKVS